ncbi:MAG TPA: heme exporter protein CcmD [Acidimicrobiales bacterium]|nr:heme exporter protein CcmD [Acidimicrobiales bacterium]
MGYVAAGYGITLVALAAYAAHLLRRGRALGRAVDERKR